MKKFLLAFVIASANISLYGADLPVNQDVNTPKKDEVAKQNEVVTSNQPKESQKPTPQKESTTSDKKEDPKPSDVTTNEKKEEAPKTPHISESYTDSWVYIKDSLLLGPGYTSSFLFPVKFFGAVGGLGVINNISFDNNGLVNKIEPREWLNFVSNWMSKKFGNSGISTNSNATNFQKLFGTVIYSTATIAAVFGGYKLVNYAIETIGYGYALNKFFLDYEKYNRAKTPDVLLPYMDKEYLTYMQGGCKYIWTRTRKVIEFIRMAVKMHEKQALDNK
jgi:hypothetical protein